jgi:hypothetical protein
MSELRDAVLRAAVFATIAERANQLKDEARSALSGIPMGDTLSARHGDRLLAKASLAKGKSKLVVTDPQRLLEWVKTNHPSEVVESVNQAYLTSLTAKAKEVGAVIDNQGAVVPGVELVEGSPTVTVRREKDAIDIVGEMLRGGLISLDSPKELES